MLVAFLCSSAQINILFHLLTSMAVFQCYIFLDQPGAVAEILEKLLRGDEVCECICNEVMRRKISGNRNA